MEGRSHLRNRDENRIYLKVWHWVNLSNHKKSVFISAVIMSMSDRITLKKSIDFIISLESIKGKVSKKKCRIFRTLVGWVGLKKLFSAKKYGLKIHKIT